jgi:hypothetical protein
MATSWEYRVHSNRAADFMAAVLGRLEQQEHHTRKG